MGNKGRLSGDDVSGDNPWPKDTRRATVFVLEGVRDKRFRAYLMRDNDLVGRVEGPLSLYGGFMEDMNKLWAASGAFGSFLWQSRRLWRLPREPVAAGQGERSVASLVLEQNVGRGHEISDRTLALFLEVACKRAG